MKRMDPDTASALWILALFFGLVVLCVRACDEMGDEVHGVEVER